jgi:chorismate mutase
MSGQLEKFRMKIDEIDDELLRLLNERTRVVAELGVVKKRRGMPIRDSIREENVLTRVREKNCGPLDEAAALRIFQSIIAESCRMQAATSGIEESGNRRRLS